MRVTKCVALANSTREQFEMLLKSFTVKQVLSPGLKIKKKCFTVISASHPSPIQSDSSLYHHQ